VERTLKILAGADTLHVIARMVEPDGIRLDPVAVDAEEGVLWQGRRCAIADAAPELGWFSPELFQRGLNARFLELAADAPSLVWLQSSAAGFNGAGFAPLVRKGVRLTTSDGTAVAMSEYVLGQVLDHFQRGRERRAAQAAAQWKPLQFHELGDTRWLIVGFGAIGREIARRARPFGVHITGVRRSGGTDELTDRIVSPDALADMLPQADVVILCVPLSRHTENLANASFFAALKPDALLLNVGRGGLLDEEALHASLDAGRPAHAVLDVMRAEPLPPESWLWRHPKVTVTAHTSAWGDGMLGRSRRLFAENLRRFVRGGPLLNEANPADVTASEGL
jgi:phosphoglycerate dehydrogenase-like enzyme